MLMLLPKANVIHDRARTGVACLLVGALLLVQAAGLHAGLHQWLHGQDTAGRSHAHLHAHGCHDHAHHAGGADEEGADESGSSHICGVTLLQAGVVLEFWTPPLARPEAADRPYQEFARDAVFVAAKRTQPVRGPPGHGAFASNPYL